MAKTTVAKAKWPDYSNRYALSFNNAGEEAWLEMGEVVGSARDQRGERI